MERLEQIREDIFDLSCRYYKYEYNSKSSFPKPSDSQIKRIADLIFVAIMDTSLAFSMYNKYDLYHFSSRMFARNSGYNKYVKSTKVNNMRKAAYATLRRRYNDIAAEYEESEKFELDCLHIFCPNMINELPEDFPIILTPIKQTKYNYFGITSLIQAYWESNGLDIRHRLLMKEPLNKGRNDANHPLMDICNKLADIIEGIPKIDDDELFTASCLALNRLESSYNLIMMKNLVSMYSPSFLESHFTKENYRILFKYNFSLETSIETPVFLPYTFHSEDLFNYLIDKNEDTSSECQALKAFSLDVYIKYIIDNCKNYIFDWVAKDLEYSRRFFMDTYLTQNWLDNTVRSLRSNVIQGTENQEKISYDFFRTFYLNTIICIPKESYDEYVKKVKERKKKVSIKKETSIPN